MAETINHGSTDGKTTFCGAAVTPQNFRIGGMTCPDCRAALEPRRNATIGSMPNQPKVKVSTFRIPPELKARAQAAAEANGTTLTAIITAELERYAKRHERMSELANVRPSEED